MTIFSKLKRWRTCAAAIITAFAPTLAGTPAYAVQASEDPRLSTISAKLGVEHLIFTSTGHLSAWDSQGARHDGHCPGRDHASLTEQFR
jgi:hypothetical protein